MYRYQVLTTFIRHSNKNLLVSPCVLRMVGIAILRSSEHRIKTDLVIYSYVNTYISSGEMSYIKDKYRRASYNNTIT